MPVEGKQLYLSPDESIFLGMAIAAMLEDVKAMGQTQIVNWTPESRKNIKDLLESGSKLKIKLERLGIDVSLPDLEPGEENNFITKES